MHTRKDVNGINGRLRDVNDMCIGSRERRNKMFNMPDNMLS